MHNDFLAKRQPVPKIGRCLEIIQLGDNLFLAFFQYDPIFQSISDEKARQRLISKFDLESTRPEWALAYQFDIVLRGREATPFET